MAKIKSKVAVYLKNTEGAIHEFSGRGFKTLRREIMSNRGGPEVLNLIESGYVEFGADDGQFYAIETLGVDTFSV